MFRRYIYGNVSIYPLTFLYVKVGTQTRTIANPSFVHTFTLYTITTNKKNTKREYNNNVYIIYNFILPPYHLNTHKSSSIIYAFNHTLNQHNKMSSINFKQFFLDDENIILPLKI